MNIIIFIPLALYFVIFSILAFFSLYISKNSETLIFISYYFGLIFSWLVYYIGIRMVKKYTLPLDRKGIAGLRPFYFLPQLLSFIGGISAVHMAIPLISGDIALLRLFFIGGLLLYSLFYLAGMVVVQRNLTGKDMFIDSSTFYLVLLYIVPGLIIGVIVTLVLNKSFAGMAIATVGGMVMGMIFIFMGVRAPIIRTKESIIYVLVNLIIYTSICAAFMVTAVAYIKVNLGRPLQLFMAWLSFLNIYTIIYICMTIVSAIVNERTSQNGS